MVALSSSAMPSRSTQCPRTLHSRHVFVECFLVHAWSKLEFFGDVVYLNLSIVRHI